MRGTKRQGNLMEDLKIAPQLTYGVIVVKGGLWKRTEMTLTSDSAITFLANLASDYIFSISVFSFVDCLPTLWSSQTIIIQSFFQKPNV